MDHSAMGHDMHAQHATLAPFEAVERSGHGGDHGDHGGDHGDHGNGNMMCSMMMTFHARACERILWNSWFASTVAEFILSAIAIFLVAFCYEALKCYREFLQKREIKRQMELKAAAERNKHLNPQEAGSSNAAGRACSLRENKFFNRIFSLKHGYQSLLYMLQVIVAYLLMLVFMLFNYWLCLAVVLGLGLGYLCFGWIKQSIDDDDCCV